MSQNSEGPTHTTMKSNWLASYFSVFAASPSSLALVLVLIASVFPIAVVLEFMQRASTPFSYVEGNRDYEAARRSVLDEVVASGTSRQRGFSYSSNIFVQLSVNVTANIITGSPREAVIRTAPPLPMGRVAAERLTRFALEVHRDSRIVEIDVALSGETQRVEVQEVVGVSLNLSSLILYAGFLLVGVVSIFAVHSQILEDKSTVTQKKSDWPSGSIDPSSLIETSVVYASVRADRINQRATYLLVSGVMMALVGVGVFFSFDIGASSPITNSSVGANSGLIEVLPASASGEVDSEVLVSVLNELNNNLRQSANQLVAWEIMIQIARAFGILVFLEAIAWFLLRQYRVQVEDHKWAMRQYMKRVNYLTSFAIAGDDSAQKAAVLATMLSEDMRGLLDNEQTTEALENLKIDPSNPVFQLVQSFVSDKKD